MSPHRDNVSELWHAIVYLPTGRKYSFDQAHDVQTTVKTVRCSSPTRYQTSILITAVGFVYKE